MKNKTLKFCFYLLITMTFFVSCGDDDDGSTPIPLRDRTEQQAIDSDSIIIYLSTHYYNSSFFETGTNHRYSDIIITEIEEGDEVPDGHTLLIDAVGNPETTTYLDTDYEYYILRLNQGGGGAPRFTDQVRVRYEGSSIEDGEIFDSRITPQDLSLVGNGFSTFGSIRAWQLVLPSFNSASDFTINNGIIDYNDFGFGVIFVPSGLGFFSGTNSGSSYDNLIFKFELLQFEQEDHDNDGVPSYLEDLDENFEVDDDTDEDGFPNYIDFDDDGDEVPTLDELFPKTYVVDTNMGEPEPTLAANEYEISRSDDSGVITINTLTMMDTDSNGKPDYLDEDITINYNE